jgi:hypothetical protein
MRFSRFIALSASALVLTVATAVPAQATFLDPCNAATDYAGDTIYDVEGPQYYEVYWASPPLYLESVCGDTLEVEDAFFSTLNQTSTDELSPYSRDAFDGFGEIYIGEDYLFATSWSRSGSTVTSLFEYVQDADTLNITGTFNQTGNTLTWTLSTLVGGNPFSGVDYGIGGNVGSDEDTIYLYPGDVWVSHDDNNRSDPVIVWRASPGAVHDYDPSNPDDLWFEWDADGSVELQAILIPNVQCYTGERDEEGDEIRADDQATFDEALDFAVNTVAADFDAYVGDTIAPFGDTSCGLAETGVDAGTIAATGTVLALGGLAVVAVRRRRTA